MSELTSVALHRRALLRLLGTDADDPELVRGGEDANEVTDQYLTRGCRAAQRWMLNCGYGGWRKRGSAITSWSGADATDGGRYTALPADFLRAFGNERQSALREADGTPWGVLVDPGEAMDFHGNGYYLRGNEQLWLTRGAQPPSSVFLEYHFKHEAWSDALADADIDFPVDARWLIVAEGAALAKEENWITLDNEDSVRIERSLMRARQEARDLSRPTKKPRQFSRPRRFGSHW